MNELDEVDDLLYGNLDEAPLIDSLKSSAAPKTSAHPQETTAEEEGPSPVAGQPIQTLDQQKQAYYQNKASQQQQQEGTQGTPALQAQPPPQQPEAPKSVLLDPNVSAQG